MLNCPRKVGQKIISDQWYRSGNLDEAGERIRIVRTAAQIIKNGG